jgi:mannose-6-phosphate isomerase-like protein (cupin superfamily)
MKAKLQPTAEDEALPPSPGRPGAAKRPEASDTPQVVRRSVHLTKKSQALEGSSRLGERVRALRKQRQLSLRQTAQQLDISPSALSMIENGTGASSLKRLQHIADYFGVALVDLLADAAPPSSVDPGLEVVRQCFSTVAGMRRGKGVWFQSVSGLPTLKVQVSLLTFEPGGGYADDRLRHEGEEAHYVLLGSVVLMHGDERVSLDQGDLVLFKSQVEHSFENASQQGPATVLSITTQAW